MAEAWYKNAWRRAVVDMHIEDWDPKFLSEYDPKNFVDMLKLAKSDSVILYAHSHVGHTNWPTKVGHMHEGLKGRDIFGETVSLCRENGIKVVAYYSLVFNNWAYEQNPDWRIIRLDGREATATNEPKPIQKQSRYGVCCPNSPYREFVKEEVGELCRMYAFEGVRFDMTFWPTICTCKHCQKRFAEEVGGEIPKEVNWTDPKWIKFQRCREKWMMELAEIATNTVKSIKPDASVEHQCSTVPLAWQYGVTSDITKYCTFLQGDFYGGELQASFVCKLLNKLSMDTPFGYETSVTWHLGNCYKTKDFLRNQVYGAIANMAAFIHINSIDPEGTLNPQVYETLGEIFEETQIYDKHLGGKICADVAIYLSTESKCAIQDDPEQYKNVSTNSIQEVQPHTENCLNVARTLVENNVPFTVLTRHNIDELKNYRIVVLPNVLMMSQEEADAFREYVRQGGGLYASKFTSLRKSDGTLEDDFMLSDVFGLHYEGKTKERITYISPTKDGADVLKQYSAKYPLCVMASQLTVNADKGTKVLGTLTYPYTDPDHPEKFASIHCNPPGEGTDKPALVLNDFGKGKCVYTTADLDNQEYHRDALMRMLRLLSDEPFAFESDAPQPVEITAFHQPENKRYVVNALNFQKVVPPIPVRDVKIRLNDCSGKVTKVVCLPDEKEIAFEAKGDGVEFAIEELEVFEMIAVCYS